MVQSPKSLMNPISDNRICEAIDYSKKMPTGHLSTICSLRVKYNWLRNYNHLCRVGKTWYTCLSWCLTTVNSFSAWIRAWFHSVWNYLCCCLTPVHLWTRLTRGLVGFEVQHDEDLSPQIPAVLEKACTIFSQQFRGSPEACSFLDLANTALVHVVSCFLSACSALTAYTPNDEDCNTRCEPTQWGQDMPSFSEQILWHFKLLTVSFPCT